MEIGAIFGLIGGATGIWIGIAIGSVCSNLVKQKKRRSLVNGLFTGTIVYLFLLIAFSMIALIMQQWNLWYVPLYISIIGLPLLIVLRKKMLAEYEE